MLWKDLLLMKFENGFRIMPDNGNEEKFFVIDDVQIEIGDEFRVGPNGYFEKIGNPTKIASNFIKEGRPQ